jgi:hypothetical protein
MGMNKTNPAELEKKTNSAGAKIRQRTDVIDRRQRYSDWRYEISEHHPKLYMQDVDYVEYGFDENGDIVFYASMEITKADDDKIIGEGYLNSILKRYGTRDAQGKFSRTVAERLGVSAYIVLYKEACKEFWVYNLSVDNGKWHHATEDEFIHFLKVLRRRKTV